MRNIWVNKNSLIKICFLEKSLFSPLAPRIVKKLSGEAKYKYERMRAQSQVISDPLMEIKIKRTPKYSSQHQQ